MRVHELAKELGVSSKELLAELSSMDIEAKSHMSTLGDDAVEKVLDKHTHTSDDDSQATEDAAPSTTTPEPVAPVSEPEATAPEQAPEPTAQVEEANEENILRIRGGLAVRELADLFKAAPNKLIAELMRMNVFASINDKLDFPVAKGLGEKFGFVVEQEKRGSEHPTGAKPSTDDELPAEDSPESMIDRPPVVTFLGHVDHGKTSLLDHIRNASVASGESGGITQHIGAYTIDLHGRKITFLDTPGHAAFTAMRARGANLTDIAVIIIAADDGIMPQTKEAISHAKAAGVAIMVAMNKMDLPGANPDRILQQLQTEGLAPEDWGGETVCCKVSAETGEGMDHLLDMIQLQAEMQELKANPDRKANGFVIEAQLEPGMGPTANVLVTGGTLRVGDTILCGQYCGRVKALINDHGNKVNSAAPSTPVKCLGLSGVPSAGSEFRVMANERRAKALAQEEALLQKNSQLVSPKKASLEDLFEHMDDAQTAELNVLLKVDTKGSLEAIQHSLDEIDSTKIKLTILHGDTGNITNNDVMLASASNAVILGFHVAKESGVDALAKHEGVEIRLHRVIYELIDQVRNAMIGRLGPNLQERVCGHAEVRQVFEVGKTGRVAGCMVISGTVAGSNRIRVKRGDETLYEGSIATLKHFQDQVKSVREAQECGIRLDHFSGFDVGDIIETYEIEEHEQTL